MLNCKLEKEIHYCNVIYKKENKNKNENEMSPLSNIKEKAGICLGIFAIIAEALCQIGSISCLQLITDLPPNFELNSVRFAIGLAFVLIYLLLTRQLPRFKKELGGWLFLGVLATYFYNLSLYSEYVKKLPLGAVFGIKQAFYVVLVAIGSRVLLKINVSKLKLAVIFAAIIGIGLVILSSFFPRSNTERQADEWNDGNLTLSAQDVPNHGSEKSNGTNTTILHTEPTKFMTDHSNECILIAIALMFTCSFCSAVENLSISGTELTEINGIFLSFWYFLFGTIASAVTSIIFEDIFIPDRTTDRVFSFVHCTLASAVTFLYILALKLLESNLVAIVCSLHIPLALTSQMFLLQSVTPPVELWVLMVGLAIITLSVFVMSIHTVCMTDKHGKPESYLPLTD